MNARLMAICTICGFVVAALIVTPGSSAPNAAGHGLFSGLKVGQMVEFMSDQNGVTIRTFEDGEGPQLSYTITEIGNDFIAFENDAKEPGAQHLEVRIPVYAFASVHHVGKAGPKRPGGTTKKKN